MVVIVKNKTEAKKEIKKFVDWMNARPYDFEQINLDRKYPVMLNLTAFDTSGFGGGMDVLVYPEKITKKFKKKFLEILI